MADLLLEAHAGSSEALAELLGEYRPFLIAVGRKNIPAEYLARMDPSDLAQEALLKAEQAFACFRGQQTAQFKAWLRSILINRLREEIRRLRAGPWEQGCQIGHDLGSKNRILDLLPKDQSTPSGHVVKEEAIAKLREAIASLPEQYQRVIRYHNYDGCSWKEVGNQLGKSEEAARKLWVRALGQLKLAMSPKDGSR
jgi:RNA polymerase sigma-70 factor (ECF subfamily)